MATRNPYSKVSVNPDWEIVNGRFVRKAAPGLPALPPGGFYDPAITNLSDANHRQYGYLQDNTATADTRNITDYLLGRKGIEQGQTRGLEDLLTQQQGEDTSYGRGFADRQLAAQRAEADTNTTLGNIARNWQQRGLQQGQQAVARGVTGAGASAQSAAKRQNAEGRDRAPVWQNFTRFKNDNQQAQNRAFETHQSNLSLIDRARGRLGQDVTDQLGQLDLQSGVPTADNPLGGRSWQDRHTGLTQAGIEDQYGQLGAQQQAWYQAALNGYQFPTSAPGAQAAPAAKRPTTTPTGRSFSNPGGLGIPFGRRTRRWWQ